MKLAFAWLGTLVVLSGLVPPVSAQCDLDHVEVIDRSVRALDARGGLIWEKTFAGGSYLQARRVSDGTRTGVVALVEISATAKTEYVLFDCAGDEQSRSTFSPTGCGPGRGDVRVVHFDEVTTTGAARPHLAAVGQELRAPLTTVLSVVDVDLVSGSLVDMQRSVLDRVEDVGLAAFGEFDGSLSVVVSAEGGDQLPVGRYQLAVYKLDMVGLADCSQLTPLNLLLTPVRGIDFDTLDLDATGHAVHRRGAHVATVDLHTGDLFDNSNIESLVLVEPTSGHFMLRPTGPNLNVDWSIDLGTSRPLFFDVFSDGGVQRVLVIRTPDLVQRYTSGASTLGVERIDLAYERLPGPTGVAFIRDPSTSLLDVFEIYVGPDHEGAIQRVILELTGGELSLAQGGSKWKRVANGVDWPLLPFGPVSIERRASDVVFRLGSEEFLADLDDGTLTNRPWISRLELNAGRTILQAYDAWGAPAWTKALDSEALAVVASKQIGHWAANLLLRPVGTAAPEIVELDVTGVEANRRPIVLENVATAPNQFVAFVDQELDRAADGKLSRHFDNVVGLVSTSVDSTYYVAVKLDTTPEFAYLGAHEGQVLDYLSPTNRLVVRTRKKRFETVRDLRFRSGPHWPGFTIDRFDFDGSDAQHPPVVNGLRLERPTLENELATLVTTDGMRYHLESRIVIYDFRELQLIEAPTPTRVVANGSAVSFYGSGDVLMDEWDVGADVRAVALTGHGGRALVCLPDASQQVWDFVHYLDAHSFVAYENDLIPPSDPAEEYLRFGGDRGEVLIAGSSFLFIEPTDELERIRTQQSFEGRFSAVWTQEDRFGARSNVLAGLRLDTGLPFASVCFNCNRSWSRRKWEQDFDGSGGVFPRKSVPIVRIHSRMEIRAAGKRVFGFVFGDGEVVSILSTQAPARGQVQVAVDPQVLDIGEEAIVRLGGENFEGLRTLSGRLELDLNHWEPLMLRTVASAADDTVTWAVADGGVEFGIRMARGLGWVSPMQDVLELRVRAKSSTHLTRVQLGADPAPVGARVSGGSFPLHGLGDGFAFIQCGNQVVDPSLHTDMGRVLGALQYSVGLRSIDARDFCSVDVDGNDRIDVRDAVMGLQRVITGAGAFVEDRSEPVSAAWRVESASVEPSGTTMQLVLGGVLPVSGFDLSVSVGPSSRAKLKAGEGWIEATRDGSVARIVAATADASVARVTLRVDGPLPESLAIPAGIAYDSSGAPFEWVAAQLRPDPAGAPITTRLALLQNQPNPFNPATQILYSLPATGQVDLRIYDSAGRWIKSLESGERSAGEHSVMWHGDDDDGRRVASGVYWYRLQTPFGDRVRKMVLLR